MPNAFFVFLVWLETKLDTSFLILQHNKKNMNSFVSHSVSPIKDL